MDDVLAPILKCYYAPTTLMPDALPNAYYTTKIAIRNDASLVNKLWREKSRIEQRKAIKAERADFFDVCLDLVKSKCLDWDHTTRHRNGACVLHLAGVTQTMFGIKVWAQASPPQCVITLQHDPIDANGRLLLCSPDGIVRPPSPNGLVRPPTDMNHTCRVRLLAEMPHYRVADKDRSEEQKAQAQAWLADFARSILEYLWLDFASLNERDWHRNRFRV
jgi:hypothetical protein